MGRQVGGALEGARDGSARGLQMRGGPDHLQPAVRTGDGQRSHRRARRRQDGRRDTDGTGRATDGHVSLVPVLSLSPSPSSASEPEHAPTGPVKVEVTGEVPAIGNHPAGQGVILSFNYLHATETELSRWALRLVQQDGRWLVEQVEDALRGEVTPEFMRATLAKEMRR